MAAAGRRRAEQQRSRTPAVLLLVAVLAAAVSVVALLVWPDGPGAGGADTAATPRPSPSRGDAPIDLSALPVPRDLDCAALDDVALVSALGGEVTDRDGYTDGDRVEIAPGVKDVAHETSCTFATAEAEARVWVFTAPVGTTAARELVRDRRRESGCTFPDLPTGFGSPGVVSVCTGSDADSTSGQDRSVSATFSGLFGDAWLSCRLARQGAPIPDAVVAGADRWCVHVATTLGAVP